MRETEIAHHREKQQDNSISAAHALHQTAQWALDTGGIAEVAALKTSSLFF